MGWRRVIDAPTLLLRLSLRRMRCVGPTNCLLRHPPCNTSRRQWITKHGSGGPAWDKSCDRTLPPREHNREALFNVYEVTQP